MKNVNIVKEKQEPEIRFKCKLCFALGLYMKLSKCFTCDCLEECRKLNYQEVIERVDD